jgi:hypothetical protein
LKLEKQPIPGRKQRVRGTGEDAAILGSGIYSEQHQVGEKILGTVWELQAWK